MTIYELINDAGTGEIKATGHHDPHEFKARIKEDLGIDVNLGDIKQSWERMQFYRNQISFPRCKCIDFGAKPVTFVRVEK